MTNQDKSFTIITDHLINRSRERLDIDNVEFKTINHASIIKNSEFLKKQDHSLNKQISYRLNYFKNQNIKEDIFGVLVISTEIRDHKAVSHVVVSVYTTEMYDENFSTSIPEKKYRFAAQKNMGSVEYRKWLINKYEKLISDADKDLHVHFYDGLRRIVKIRNKLCEPFKINENPEETLKHPGVLTSVNTQLKEIGKTLNDRKFMRYSSDEGMIKMTKLEAEKCPYCGMEPLETDVSAIKPL